MAEDTESTQKTQPSGKSEEQWRQELDAERYHVLREKGTEPAFTGEYCDLKDKGIPKSAK